MLITTCTHCLARFRVTPQQLNEKQGQVRCGRCRTVFSGFEALERFPDDDTGSRLLAARDAQVGEAAETLTDFDAPDLELPVPAAPPQPARESQSPAREAQSPARDAQPPAREAQPPSAPNPLPARAAKTPGPVEPPAPTPSRPLAPKPARAQAALQLEPPPRKRPSRAWAFGVALMLLVLSVEAAYGFRASIAKRYPVARPWLEATCARIGCAVPWPREEALLKLEDSELNEVPGRAGEIALGARIRNLAAFAQEYPSIQLTLSDVTGQPAVRRVLRPADYLGRPVGSGESLAAGADLAIQLRLETARMRPTGYELLLFYP